MHLTIDVEVTGSDVDNHHKDEFLDDLSEFIKDYFDIADSLDEHRSEEMHNSSFYVYVEDK